MAGSHLQELGLTGSEASDLAASLVDRLNITEATAIDELLAKYTCLTTALSPADWCRCFRRTPDLLSVAPASLAAGLNWLQELFRDVPSILVDTLLECPGLMQQDKQEIDAKVQLFQRHCITADGGAPLARQVIARLASHALNLLCQPVADLQAKIKHLAAVLRTSDDLAAQMIFDVPGIAEYLVDVTSENHQCGRDRSVTQLEQWLDMLEEILSLDGNAVRELSLRQPDLLIRSIEELQQVSGVVEELFGCDKLAEVALATPQILCMDAATVKAHSELLHTLAQLQPSWQGELADAPAQMQAVWLASSAHSEGQLRRLEVAAASEQVSQLSIQELLSLAEDSWSQQATAEGMGVPDSSADVGTPATNQSQEAGEEQHNTVSQESCRASSSDKGQATELAPAGTSTEEAAPPHDSHNSPDDMASQLPQTSNVQPSDLQCPTNIVDQQPDGSPAVEAAVSSGADVESTVTTQLLEVGGSAGGGVVKESTAGTQASTADGGYSGANTRDGRCSTAAASAAAAAERGAGIAAGLLVKQREAAGQQDSGLSREAISTTTDNLDSPQTQDGDVPAAAAAALPAEPAAASALSGQASPAAAAAAAAAAAPLAPAHDVEPAAAVVALEQDLPSCSAPVPALACGSPAAIRSPCSPPVPAAAPLAGYCKVVSLSSSTESGAAGAKQPSSPPPVAASALLEQTAAPAAPAPAPAAAAVPAPEQDLSASSAVPAPAAAAPAGESAAEEPPCSPPPPAATPLVDDHEAVPTLRDAESDAEDEEQPSSPPALPAAAALTGDVAAPSTSAGSRATLSQSPEPTSAGSTEAEAANQFTAADELSAAQPRSPNRGNNSTSTTTSTSIRPSPAKATISSSPAAAATVSKSVPTSSTSNIEAERREAFMSKLLAQVPTYAVTLLGTDQADKLLFLSHMAPADLSAVLAQPNSEELLEAVYAVHLGKLQQQQQQKGGSASTGEAASTDRKHVCSTNSSNSSNANSTAAGGNAGKSSAASAAAGCSKLKASTAAASTPNKPAVGKSTADVQQQPAVTTDQGRKYLFVDGPVCNVCGSRGHLGADCRTARCGSCQQIGHPPGKCSEACRVCGKRHRPGPCSVPFCDYCKLHGHLLQQCPTAHCKKCDCYGHVPSLCPAPKQQQTAAGVSGGSSSSKSAAPAPAAAAAMAALRPAATAAEANGHSSSSKPGAPAVAAAAATTALQPSLGTAARPQAPTARNATHFADRGMAGSSDSEAAGLRAAAAAASTPQRHERPAAAPAVRNPIVNLTTDAAALPAQASAAAPGAAAVSSFGKGILVEDGSKTYLFNKGVVCSRCGKPGHLGSLCATSWCGSCRVFGHRYGECEQACYTCGRKHAFTINGGKPVCYTSRCSLCSKFCHSADDCPAARCSGCGYYGHTRSGCPTQQRQQSQQVVADHQLGISTSPSSMQYSTAADQSSSGPSAAYSSSCSTVGAAAPPTSRAHSSLQFDKPDSSSRISMFSRPQGVAAVSAAPAAAAARHGDSSTISSSTSKWITLVDSGTHYKCHQYPACTTCGTVGHLSGSCKTPFCSGCGKFGHLTNRCHSACQTCGKQHDPGEGGCYMPLCPSCMLYGHIGKHCPSAQCSTCGYFGHVARICPDKFLGDAAMAASVGTSSKQQHIDSSRAQVPSSRAQAMDTSRRVEQTDRAVVCGSSSSSRGLSQQDGWGETAAGASRSSRPLQSDGWGDTPSGTHSGNRPRTNAPTIQGKQYRFLGAPACDRCGRIGHIGAECHADFCKSCQKWGHETGSCSSYCRKCGKNHARGGCTMAMCPHCQLWGHSAKRCPAVQCTSCGHWGHSAQVCPDQQQPGISRAAQSSGTAQNQGHSSGRAAPGDSPAAAAAAAVARAMTGGDSDLTSNINAAVDSWPDRHVSNFTFSNSSSGWGNGGVVAGPASAAGPKGVSMKGGPTAQFVLEPPAASDEEDKARGARLVHTLFASLPQYASTLMGDKEKLSCLARLTPADLQYVLAQKHPEHLLDAVYQAQQQKRHQTAQMQQQVKQFPEHRIGRGEAMAGPQAVAKGGGPTRVSTQQASRATGVGHQARVAAPDASSADSSSILMQQMAATLAGFKQLSGKQHTSESALAGAHVMAGDEVFGLKRGFSEDEDISDMLGFLGVQHP